MRHGSYTRDEQKGLLSREPDLFRVVLLGDRKRPRSASPLRLGVGSVEYGIGEIDVALDAALEFRKMAGGFPPPESVDFPDRIPWLARFSATARRRSTFSCDEGHARAERRPESPRHSGNNSRFTEAPTVERASISTLTNPNGDDHTASSEGAAIADDGGEADKGSDSRRSRRPSSGRSAMRVQAVTGPMPANEVRHTPWGYRLQPGESPAPAHPATCPPKLVAHEPAAAAIQNRGDASSGMPGTSSCSWPKADDSAPVYADHPAHRAARVASDLIEGTGHGGRETRNKATLAGVFLRWVVSGGEPSARAGLAALAP